MSNITISQLPVSTIPTQTANASLRMDRRFGTIIVDGEAMNVETHIFLEQKVIPVKDGDPLVDVIFHTFCLFNGDTYKCSGRKSMSGLTCDATEWKSTVKRYKGEWPDASNSDNIFLTKDWVNVKQS